LPANVHYEGVLSDQTRLLLIRHGESRSEAEGWISGPATCGGLTERGRAQSAALRDRLHRNRALQPDAVLTSPMARAVETTEIITAGLDVGVVVQRVHELSERTPGECEGISLNEYRVRYGRRAYSDWENALSGGGETNDEFLERVSRVIGRIADELQGRTALLICHGGIIMGTAVLLMQGPISLTAPQWQNPANTAISEWCRSLDGDRAGPWRLHRYNDHAHIED
jgi:probable phosphoglycerate mutase